jgi:hypothetical protein
VADVRDQRNFIELGRMRELQAKEDSKTQARKDEKPSDRTLNGPDCELNGGTRSLWH